MPDIPYQKLKDSLSGLRNEIEQLDSVTMYGRVIGVQGLLIEIMGPTHVMGVGSRVEIETAPGRYIHAEIVGFQGERALAMPFGALDGVRMGCRAILLQHEASVQPCHAWLGRVVNGLAEPVDGKGALLKGAHSQLVRGTPPAAHKRARVGGVLDLGVRVLNTFVTCCQGQRLGIFAGSGVGKSVLMSMMARNAACDVAVIGLIGERGREVQEFLEDDLGAEGMRKSVVVVATSDEPALMRRQAAYLTFTIAEYFRDQGLQVLCMMDSVTRFAMAQREIGLSAGEPPTTKGYTPTVFAELPKLLERAGPGEVGSGSITGLFTVLVDGDDHNEPVADAVRGILDGHIVMERRIAEQGRYPAVNVLKSISRTMPNCVEMEYRPVIQRAKNLMAQYGDMEELIKLGAYRAGSNAQVDEAIHFNPMLDAFLAQGKHEAIERIEGLEQLKKILEGGG